MLISIIVRTLNEALHFEQLLTGIRQQELGGLQTEVIVVDSGSTDDTLEIAQGHKSRVVHITREEFSFGRALNVGCEAARGTILVFVSGHCIPVDRFWLQRLCAPLIEEKADYSYGRQLGGPSSYYSEKRIFAKYYPAHSRIPQEGFFCNNANSAIIKKQWAKFRFDEELTGLEDMELGMRLTNSGGKIAYVAEAEVFHLHNEDWPTVQLRFEREAIALQKIMPHVQIRTRDLCRYIFCSIWLDWRQAWQDGVFYKTALEIIRYRLHQYRGSFHGNHDSRTLSRQDKDIYFYPTTTPDLNGGTITSQANDGDGLKSRSGGSGAGATTSVKKQETI